MKSYLFSLLPAACAVIAIAGAADAKPARKTPPAATRAVQAANAAAIQEPKAGSFLNAVQVYTWTEGAVFRLFTAPEKVSDIALQPGEELIAVSAGDTARWVIGDTVSGSGEGKQAHILVKPYTAGLKTNLVITTNRRTYHVQLESTPATAMAAIAWRYPQEQILTRKVEAAAVAAPVPAPITTGLPLERLSFGYAISGDRPAWRPARAFDDGSKVYIEFPAGFAQTEVAPLFLVAEDGKADLLNYRVQGRFYVVDTLFDKAELRLGAKRQSIVRITRMSEKVRGGGHD
jgi:type IV secretion system protein TrbG